MLRDRHQSQAPKKKKKKKKKPMHSAKKANRFPTQAMKDLGRGCLRGDEALVQKALTAGADINAQARIVEKAEKAAQKSDMAVARKPAGIHSFTLFELAP